MHAMYVNMRLHRKLQVACLALERSVPWVMLTLLSKSVCVWRQMPPNLDVEGAEAGSSSSEATQQWFFSLPVEKGSTAAAQARGQVALQLHTTSFMRCTGPMCALS